jgi:site-specific recombinase XerD
MNGQNMAVKTKRHYIATMKQFTQWLHDTGRLSKNNFKLIKNPKVLQSDQVRARRALTADEIKQFLSINTPQAKAFTLKKVI